MLTLASLAMVAGVSWRSVSAKSCRPSFISSLPLQRLHARTLFPPSAIIVGGSSAHGRHLHNSVYGATTSSDGWRRKPPFLHSSSSPLTTTTTEQLKPFTWTELLELFRDHDKDNQYISSDHQNLELFRRSEAAQALYETHKEYLDNNWRSAYDYLVYSKFGEDFWINKEVINKDGCDNSNVNLQQQIENINQSSKRPIPPKGHMYKANPSLTEASQYTIKNGITYLKLVLNDFPYDVDESIEHWCLWKIGGKSNTEGLLREELNWALKELKCLDASISNVGSGCIIDREGELSQTGRVGSSEKELKPISDVLYWVNPPALQSMPEMNHAHMLVLRSSASVQSTETIHSCPPPV